MKIFRIMAMIVLISISMDLISSDFCRFFDHDVLAARQSQNDASSTNKHIKALCFITLLLTPVSWKHAVAIPHQQQFPIMDESPAENFVRTYNQQKNNRLQPGDQNRLSEKRFSHQKNQHVSTTQYEQEVSKQKFVGNLRVK